MVKLLIILGSTRRNRQGEKVAHWICALASTLEGFEIELVDLADWPLPFFDEPMPPARLNGHYSCEIAQRWSQKIDQADGFILVTPEYNHGYPAVLKNALDYLFYEWSDKPVAFASYSNNPSGGARAVEQLRQVVIELQMIPIRENLCIPAMWQTFNGNGSPKDETILVKAGRMIEQLSDWAQRMKKVRLDTANGKKASASQSEPEPRV